MECKSINNRSRLANNLVTILRTSYGTKQTVAARPKGTAIRFNETISIATPIYSNYYVLRNGLVRTHTQYKNICGKDRSIYPSLVWHATEKTN